MKSLDRLLLRLYERGGMKLTATTLVAFELVIMLAATVIAASTLAGYFGLSVSEYVSYTTVSVAVIFPAAIAGLLLSRRELRALFSWSGAGRTAEQAPETWRAIVRLPQIVTRAALTGALGGAASLIYFVAHFHEPWWVAFPLSAAAPLAIGGAWVVCLFTGELLLRPMLADVAAKLPATFEPPRGGLSLWVRAFGPLLFVTDWGINITAAFTGRTHSGALRFAIVTGIALQSLVLAGLIFMIVVRSVVDPLGEVIEATKRVREGDLDTTLPLTSADELGTLKSGFNEMLAGLREREALRSELEASRARIVATADEERRRIERDLHDGAQQHIILAQLKLGLLDRSLEAGPDTARATVAELRGDLERALSELRDLAHGLYPAVLESGGLPGALAEAAGRATLPATLDSDGVRRYAPELEAAVYFCCLEALQNAAKHAGERAHVEIRLTEDGHALRFEVADDGSGFDSQRAPPSAGLQNMADRIGALGGELAVESEPGHGTTVQGKVPT